MTIPRGEYPRPQFVRDAWLCLNGEWGFEIDAADSGLERGLLARDLSGTILVPFCPESSLSGIGCDDFMNVVWYRREVDVPAEWAGRKVLLHFGAVDYDATVWVNGQEVGRHRGGWSSFTCDLSGAVEPGRRATLVVRARDDVRRNQPSGKQCPQYKLWNCFYTRTTGIWQTVWMEPVPEMHLKRPRITPDVAGRRFRIVQPVSENRAGWRVRAAALWEGKQVAEAETPADADFAPSLDLVIPEDEVHLWGPGDGNLYDLVLELVDADGNVADSARSYAGLRSITLDGRAFKVNGRTVFQRFVLDQGYYPDGIMTAPSDAALQHDTELAMAAGFNGARLHEKVFEERFLYHADRMGYLVWGEFGDCGFDLNHPPCSMITQWLEVLERDYNHPSIIGWCALVETIESITDRIRPLGDLMRGLFLAAKAMDPTRPVLDTSGGSHWVRETDIWDTHDYDQDAAKLAEHHALVAEGRTFLQEPDRPNISLAYGGQPYFVGEFGGIWWNPEAAEDEGSWGYGERPKSVEEFHRRFEALCNALLDNPHIFGYCYTQLTDVYQEQNGICFFDRRAKFDLERLRAVQSRQAAIETAG